MTAEGLQDFFKGVSKAATYLDEKIFTNPSRALERATNLSTAVATKIQKQ